MVQPTSWHTKKRAAYANKTSNHSDINNLGECMDKYLKTLPIGIFCLVILNSLIRGFTWENVAVASAAAILAAVYEAKNHSRQIEAIETKYKGLLENAETKLEVVIGTVNNQAKAIEEVRSSIGSVRIAQQAKTLTTAAPVAGNQRLF
jgi:hypothetical protein